MKSTLCRTYFKCIRRDLDSTFALGLSYLMHVHSHINQAVVAMKSCFKSRYWPDRGLVLECVTYFYYLLHKFTDTAINNLGCSTFSAHAVGTAPLRTAPTC